MLLNTKLPSKSAYFSLPKFCGALLILLSLSVITGLVFKITILTSILPGYINMVFNTAFCFGMAGIALISLQNDHSTYRFRAFFYLGLLILTIALLSLSQSVFGVSNGIDQLIIKVPNDHINPYPGRMAINTAFCFIMASIVFIFLPFTRQKWASMIVSLLIFLIFFLGLSALLGYLLKLSFLFSWYRYSQMALHTASGMVALGIGLGSIWFHHKSFEYFLNKKEDLRVILISSIIIFFAVYISAIVGFATISQDNQGLLKSLLAKSFSSQSQLLLNSIDKSDLKFKLLIQEIELSALNKDSFEKTLNLNLSSNFSYVALYNSSNRLIYQFGNPLPKGAMNTPLKSKQNIQLLWSDGFFLQHDIQLPANHLIRRVVTLSPLNEFTISLSKNESLGTSNETVLCIQKSYDVANCFPSRLTPHPFVRTLGRNTDTPRAMSYALFGKSGLLNYVDYRGESVIGFYGPVGHLGLGMVNKVDTRDLYQSVRSALLETLSILILTILLSIGFIYWQIQPLIKRVVNSEQTALKQEALRKESENKLRAILGHIGEGIATIDEAGIIQSFNNKAQLIFGFTESELLGQSLIQLMPSIKRILGLEYYSLNIKENTFNKKDIEVLGQRKNGEEFPLELSISELTHEGKRIFTLILRDITQKKALEAELEKNRKLLMHQASHDPLTGLSNRTQFEHDFETALNRAKRSHEYLAVLFCDLDHFKEVNDQHGHNAGDLLLKQIADSLRYLTRATDIVARVGGDEFVIILTQLKHINDAEVVVEKILRGIENPLLLNGKTITPSISIGASLYPKDASDTQQLLKLADIALYSAKQNGRNQYALYQPTKDSP